VSGFGFDDTEISNHQAIQRFLADAITQDRDCASREAVEG
jgi:hypothetical protein